MYMKGSYSLYSRYNIYFFQILDKKMFHNVSKELNSQIKYRIIVIWRPWPRESARPNANSHGPPWLYSDRPRWYIVISADDVWECELPARWLINN